MVEYWVEFRVLEVLSLLTETGIASLTNLRVVVSVLALLSVLRRGFLRLPRPRVGNLKLPRRHVPFVEIGDERYPMDEYSQWLPRENASRRMHSSALPSKWTARRRRGGVFG